MCCFIGTFLVASTYPSVLWRYQTGSNSVWCKWQGAWSCALARQQASMLCFPCVNWCWDQICINRSQEASRCVCLSQVPPVHIWQKYSCWNRPQVLAGKSTKPLSQVPLRLQKMILNLRGYDVEVRYIPWNKQIVADTLSRAAVPSAEKEG